MLLYTTLERLKSFLEVSDDSEDESLERLIAEGTAMLDAELGDNLGLATVTRRMDGEGSVRLVLPERPVSVEAVRVLSGGELAAVDFIDGKIVHLCAPAPRGRANIEIRYVRGYETVPADLERFFLEYLRTLRRSETEGAEEVKSKKMGDLAIEYFAPGDLAGRPTPAVDWPAIRVKYGILNLA